MSIGIIIEIIIYFSKTNGNLNQGGKWSIFCS